MGKLTQLTQDGCVCQLTTPLGKDVLCLTAFSGSEGLGQSFEFYVDALSEQDDIDFDKAIGQSCTIKLEAYKGKRRFFNGILTQAQWVEKEDDLFHYKLLLRPWFWLLGHQADCRIFLDKNVKQIIEEVFTKAGFSGGNDFEFRTTENYDQIPYCVQYRESDLAFCSRLMEQYGIYYFFEHFDGRHTMVLADSRSSHKPNPDVPKLPYIGLDSRELRVDQFLGDWISERRFRTGKVQFNDYDYLAPKKDLKAPKEASEKYSHSKLEVYDYPGKYDDKGKGEKFAQHRLEAEQAHDHRRFVVGDAASLFAGTLVTVERHPIPAENREYLVVRASHRFGVQRYRTSGGGEREANVVYEGSYEFLPSDRSYRMLPVTPKPHLHGIQTAKVVGKKGEDGEEISTDENGHIWVQFYWDRVPQKSCPIRVAQSWSGKKWGEQHIPRIGMEVVVEFLEGDPDRPLVTGCVYNGDNKYPYDLPGNKTQSGWKSRSSKGGSDQNFNEFFFEDKKGDELVRLQCEKNHRVIVKASQDGSVGGDQSWDIGHDRTWTIGNDDTMKVGGDQMIRVAGSQAISIGQAQTVIAGTSITLIVGGSTVTITPGSVSIEAPEINLMADGPVNIFGSAVNVGPVLNCPTANFGAATVSGVPV
jgi:type VI secretion system secreted protein VgrG